jgi:two-component sensor histidine kinase
MVEISLTVSPIRAADGRIIGASKIARDISERRRFEEIQRELSRELNHRSKNLLAIVQSIIRHTVTRSSPEAFLERIGERLQGLSANQDLLIESGWRGAEMLRVVQAQLTQVTNLTPEQVSLNGDSVFLSPTAAQTLGIAIHELASNAVRHGALSTRNGRVTINWLLGDSGGMPELIITWRETDGPPVAPPGYAGFGTAIIRRITGQSVGGKVTTEFEPTGLTWELRAPARDLMAVPSPFFNSVAAF